MGGRREPPFQHQTMSKSKIKPAGIGDNSGDPKAFAIDRLKNLVERIERLEQERKGLSGDIRDIYVEAKSAGFDVRVLRKLIQLRKDDPDERSEKEQLLDTYKQALGM